jgi:hypothetical protein
VEVAGNVLEEEVISGVLFIAVSAIREITSTAEFGI